MRTRRSSALRLGLDWLSETLQCWSGGRSYSPWVGARWNHWRSVGPAYGRVVSLPRRCSSHLPGGVQWAGFKSESYGHVNVSCIRQGYLPEAKRGDREDRMCQLPPVCTTLTAIVAPGCIREWHCRGQHLRAHKTYEFPGGCIRSCRTHERGSCSVPARRLLDPQPS